MSVVSDKQKQAGSGSAPATPQGNNLPPAVPPPSISRNPLRGSKCNCLHCHYLYPCHIHYSHFNVITRLLVLFYTPQYRYCFTHTHTRDLYENIAFFGS